MCSYRCKIKEEVGLLVEKSRQGITCALFPCPRDRGMTTVRYNIYKLTLIEAHAEPVMAGEFSIHRVSFISDIILSRLALRVH